MQALPALTFLRRVSFLLCLLLASFSVQASSVVFLNPGFATENFWLGYSTYLGGCAMVRLHTYAAGLDFAERGGKDQQARVFRLVDEQQARCLLLHMDDGGKSQDFRHFGAMQHPRQRRYEFTIDTLLR